MRPGNKIPSLLWASALCIFLSGCSLWNNFTTYFNVYYNASRQFGEVETDILQDQHELFSFKDTKPQETNIAKLTKVIEKASKILQFKQDSKFFDDALLITGKCFYYQQNYEKASRKFLELGHMKDSDLGLENMLWLGKTYIQDRNFEKGYDLLESAKTGALKDNREEIYAEAYVKQISYLIYREKYKEASSLANEFISKISDKKLQAQASYELGKIYLKMNDSTGAEGAFKRVMSFEPSYDVSYKSQMEYAKLKKHLGDSEGSLSILKELRAQNKFADFFPEIELEMGFNSYERGRVSEAMDKFRIVDTVYKKTPSSALAQFMRGKIWERDYHNFDSSMVYYGRAKNGSIPEEYRRECNDKFGSMQKFTSLRRELQKYGKWKEYISDPSLFKADSAKYQQALKKDTSKKDLDANLKKVGNEPKKNLGLEAPQRPNISVDSLDILLAKNKLELGNMFLGDFEIPDSAFVCYKSVLKDYPETQFTPRAYYSLGSYYLLKNDKETADSLYGLIVKKYPKDKTALDAYQRLGIPPPQKGKLPEENEYMLAESLMNKKKYREAIEIFKNIHRINPKSDYAAKGYYAAGFIYENYLLNADSAVAMYDSLGAKFRASEYFQAVYPKLNAYRAEQLRIKAHLDSLKTTQTKLDAQKKEGPKVSPSPDRGKEKAGEQLKPLDKKPSQEDIKRPKPAPQDSTRQLRDGLKNQASLPDRTPFSFQILKSHRLRQRLMIA